MKCQIGTNYEKTFEICFVAFVYMQNSSFLMLWGNTLRGFYAIKDNSILIDIRIEYHRLPGIPAIFKRALYESSNVHQMKYEI